MWRNDTLMMLIEWGSRLAAVAVILTAVGALALFATHVYHQWL